LAFLYDTSENETADSGYRVPDAFFTLDGLNGYSSNRILADMIPARTFAAGRNVIPSIVAHPQGNRNIDMSTLKDNGRWTDEDAPHYRWRHGDLKKVSYYYTFKIYLEIVNSGELK
jgi:hypothetical protein